MKIFPGVSYHSFDDKVYVHSVDSQKDYIFGGVALDVLDFCRDNPDCALQDICNRIAEQYAVDDVDELRQDISEFVNQLMDEKILYVGDDPNAELPWSNKIPMEVAEAFAKEHKLFSIALELTYRCVERCIHCYIDDAPKFDARDELSLDEYKRVLRQAHDMGCVSLLITGGEVLVRSDFCDIVEYATSLGFIVDIYTTGIGLTDEIFDRLRAAKINGISVSLYSGDPKVHDAITGVRGSFEKTLKATLMFKAAGINTFVKCVAMKQNIDSLESLYDLGKRLDIYVSVSPRVISGHDGKCSEDYSLFTVDLYKKYYELNSRYVSVDATAEKLSRDQMLDKASCGAGINAFSIDPFGGVHGCNTFHESFGSVRKDSLKDIWERARHINLRNRRMRDVTPQCATCEYLEYCTVCVADLINKNGRDFRECGETLTNAKAAAAVLK